LVYKHDELTVKLIKGWNVRSVIFKTTGSLFEKGVRIKEFFLQIIEKDNEIFLTSQFGFDILRIINKA